MASIQPNGSTGPSTETDIEGCQRVMMWRPWMPREQQGEQQQHEQQQTLDPHSVPAGTAGPDAGPDAGPKPDSASSAATKDLESGSSAAEQIGPLGVIQRYGPNILASLFVTGVLVPMIVDTIGHRLDLNDVYAVLFVAFAPRALMELTGLNNLLARFRKDHPIAGKWAMEGTSWGFAAAIAVSVLLLRWKFSDRV